MKYGFSLIVRGNDATPDTFARIAERAEALQIDSGAAPTWFCLPRLNPAMCSCPASCTPSIGRNATGNPSPC